MTKKLCMFIFIISLILYTSAVVAADEKPDLKLNISVEKQVVVEDKDGKKTVEWQQVKDTNPEDTLKYTIHYINEGKSEARSAVIVDPVPTGTVYIDNSAEGKDSGITFSLDGKTFEAPPMLTYSVKQTDGTETKHVATPAMYTHIKWKLSKPVPQGSSGTVSFMVKVK